jgi:ABC-type Fe3+ transport system permease subunit
VAAIKLSRTHRLLVAIVLAGAVLIATIGFVGSYAAVRDLAERKGFGEFAPFFPIGIDAGIVVLLSLDLLLTWLRIPFPLLRQTAWLLTAATVAFNGAAAWGDPRSPPMSIPSYSRCASRMVIAGARPSFRLASCCNVEVVKGG